MVNPNTNCHIGHCWHEAESGDYHCCECGRSTNDCASDILKMEPQRDEFGFPHGEVPWERIKFYLRQVRDDTLSRGVKKELEAILERLP